MIVQPVGSLALQAVVALLGVLLQHRQGLRVVLDALVRPGIERRHLGIQGTVGVPPAQLDLLGLDPVQRRVVHADPL